jgi:hypothetical protein
MITGKSYSLNAQFKEDSIFQFERQGPFLPGNTACFILYIAAGSAGIKIKMYLDATDGTVKQALCPADESGGSPLAWRAYHQGF